MTKLFVTDLDGTLLPSGIDVSTVNINAAKKMAAAGITVTVATGRMYKAALPVAKKLGVNVPIITYNGALIKTVGGELIHAEYIAPELALEALDFCREKGWYVQIYSDDELYYAERTAEAIGYETAQKIEGHAVGEEIRHHVTNVTKLLSITSGREETDERVKIFNAHFDGRLKATRSNANYAEIVNPTVSKAAAIGILAAKMNIAIADVTAIGDSDNDLPMLKAAGTSIAMGNAARNVKDACDFVTTNCEEDGFAAAAEKFVLGELAAEKKIDDQPSREDNLPRLVIVTGMSGGGKTEACRRLEDLGYFCVDNLPPIFIPKFVELSAHSGDHVAKVVLVVDTRSRDFFDQFVQVLDDMDAAKTACEILFMDATDEAIVRRYKETRRRHPLAPNSRITDGIARERERLAPIRSRATYIIDTSSLKKVQLKEKIQKLFGSKESAALNVDILSFGFKYGMPLDADMVLDVRFLPNPFYIPELRHKSGEVKAVADYIGKWSVTTEFTKRLDSLVDFLIPQYVKEGKSQLVVAVGCTGGMHRSVYIARHLYDFLKERGLQVKLEHRDLMKNDVWEHTHGEAPCTF